MSRPVIRAIIRAGNTDLARARLRAYDTLRRRGGASGPDQRTWCAPNEHEAWGADFRL